MLRPTNIEERLQKHRDRVAKEADILRQVKAILKQDDDILELLTNGQSSAENDFNFDLLHTENIYHVDHIKKICIDYRLRFLDTKYFKGDYPKSALQKIKALEEAHDTTLSGFKIVAPSKLFKLKNPDDPLLFAPIGNDYYYLVHKWGADLHPLRRLLMWPFKTFENLMAFIVLVSYVLTLMVPSGLFSKNAQSSAEFWLLFFFMFKMVASVVLFYGFALGKNFNTAIWNNKYSKT